jgi:ABC-type nitrate/sulfonate/bicarbonate transport system ATPase subunit
MSDQVRVEKLEKRFGEHQVISDLSFSLAAGERLALFAPSGAGKTTLIRILAGLELADGGTVLVADPAPVVLFQEPRLFPFMTVEENILLPFRANGRSISEETIASYRVWLRVCELMPYIHYYPYQLSGGMRQKVAVIRGFLGNPRLALLDEPFQSISYAAKQEIINHILTTQPEISLLFVTHIVEEIPLLAQSVLFFHLSCLNQPEKLAALDLPERLSGMYPSNTQETDRSIAHRAMEKEIL